MSLVKVYIDGNIGNVWFDTKTGITYKNNWLGTQGDRISTGSYIKNKILTALGKQYTHSKLYGATNTESSAKQNYLEAQKILNRKPVRINSTNKVIYIDKNTGKFYNSNNSDTSAKLTGDEANEISKWAANDKSVSSINDKIQNNTSIIRKKLGFTTTTNKSDNTRDVNINDKPRTDRGGDVHTRGTGGNDTGTNTHPQTYNYKFGQYYTADPNDSSKSIANDYFNADKYSNRIDAFKAAQDAGHGVFTWRGKAYNTMDKGDDPLEFRRKHSDYDAFIGRAHMKNGDDGIDNSGGWSGSKNYNRDNVFNNQQINPITADQANNNTLVSYNQQSQTPQTPQRTRLQKFTDDDIRSLGFNNYQGLLNAANNPNNSNNRFLQSMYDRYGSNTSKWNQTTIENDLGVKGKYRRFGGGDFGDMSRSMMAWVGKNNGEIDKQNLQNRTGSNGTVYSSKKMKDLFEKYDPKKQQSVQTPATQTNTSTPSTTQNQQTTSQQSGTSNYKFPINQNNNTFSGNYLNPYSNFGYALSHYKKFQKGGTINMEEQQLQQAFLQYLMQETGAKDQQQLEQVIQQLGEEGLKQAYSKFLQEIQQQQVQAAKFGAKLNYIRRLNGQCPDGTEMTYFKVGGKLCKKCIQRQQREKEAEEPSDPIKAFKCGRKMKRK